MAFHERIMRLLFKQKARWEEMVRSSFAPPLSAILGATLLADKSEWTKEFSDQLNASGLTHVTAISGQHITIIAAILLPLFLGLGFWRRRAILLSLFCIFAFIAITGFEASAVRAGIMGSFGLWGVLAGRKADALRLLVFAAALMLVWNPLLFSRDVGFQLSFLAVLGIIWFLPFFQRFCSWLPESFGVRDAAAMTLAAQVFAAPVLVLSFGQISLVAPITNILIGPIAPLLIIFGFLFLAAGMLLGSWGSMLFSVPLLILLSYFSLVVDLFSRIPFAILVP